MNNKTNKSNPERDAQISQKETPHFSTQHYLVQSASADSKAMAKCKAVYEKLDPNEMTATKLSRYRNILPDGSPLYIELFSGKIFSGSHICNIITRQKEILASGQIPKEFVFEKANLDPQEPSFDGYIEKVTRGFYPYFSIQDIISSGTFPCNQAWKIKIEENRLININCWCQQKRKSK